MPISARLALAYILIYSAEAGNKLINIEYLLRNAFIQAMLPQLDHTVKIKVIKLIK